MITEFLLDNLRNIREDQDLTQEDMAKILNVSQPNYARWEKKVKIIPLTKLNQLCNYFKLSMDYVVGLSNKRIIMSNDNVLNKKLIGKNIKNIRKRYNLTQSDLAITLHTTQSVISAYENGKTLILTSFLIQICNIYHLSMDKICNRK